ncbi:MAG TPA: DinB family protein [Thermoanaerobaculia bacterium]|nr:DinB family protein [Thermoanaerobaculia bacterium]
MPGSQRPTEAELAPFYAAYVARVPAGDVVALLDGQRGVLRDLAAAVPAELEGHRYAPGKWSVREVFGHLIDAERVFGYRAFRIGRGDETPLEGFDENRYVDAAGCDGRPLRELAAELVAVRQANLWLFRGLGAAAWSRRGLANDSPVSVRALAYILAGHVDHHLAVLESRYGISLPPAPAPQPA